MSSSTTRRTSSLSHRSEHLLAERGADQRPVTAVLGLVHAEDDVLAHRRAHDLGEHRRREGVAVEQHPGHVVVARHDEHRRRLTVATDLSTGVVLRSSASSG